MKATVCGYGENRSEVLVSYLYGDIAEDERARFELHLGSCSACRSELDALSDVRGQLGLWAPPEPAARPSGLAGNAGRAGVTIQSRGRFASLGERWPVWAQVAAAALFVGVAAGIANVHVSYTPEGLSVSTGWMRAPRSSNRPSDASTAAVIGQRESRPWQGDLSLLEERLRTELREQLATEQRAALRPAGSLDQAAIERLRGLVQESERRQQSELALRLAEVTRDMQAQRQADLVKIDRSMGIIQNRTGMEVMRQQQLLNNLLRVSQKQ